MIEDILNQIVATLQAWPALSDVKKYDIVDGMARSNTSASISVFAADEDYEEYTRDNDQNKTNVRIMVYTSDLDVSRGETTIRGLAKQVRFCLRNKKNRKLGGLIDGSFVKKISYLSDAVNSSDVRHWAEITFEVIWYEPTEAADDPLADPVYTADVINAKVNDTSFTE